MSADRSGDVEKGPPAVWEYLRRRAKLDEEIQSKFARPITVMFTDIKGSTTFFDMRGDIEGITMLQRHNELVVPPIVAEQGRVVKGLGDGLMVVFPVAASAVRAAIEIQRALAKFNTELPEREQIRLRIGINAGIGLVEENDVFGDVVNAAARVQGLAEPDQILVSESAYREASGELGVQGFRPLGPASLKGKLEHVPIYEVGWSPTQSRVRGITRGVPEATPEVTHKVLRLELSLVGGRLKVSSYERGDGGEETLRGYEDCEYDAEQVRETVDRMGAILNASDSGRSVSAQDLDTLARLGNALYERLLPSQTRAKLADSSAVEIMLVIDDQLVQVPWELLHDGEEFLCLRFGIGRIVSTRQQAATGPAADERQSLCVLIVADPRGDLPEARREGERLGRDLGRHSQFKVVTKERMTADDFRAQFGQCDVLHFAGHADYDPTQPASAGFLLSDGRLGAGDLQGLTEGARVPRLVFFNACQSGRTEPWSGPAAEAEVCGLANSILLTGVKHYVGSVRELHDTAGLQYALEFYRRLGTGQSIGVALRDARRAVAQSEGKASLTWASYVLYGDPTARYLPARVTAAPPERASAPFWHRRWKWLAAGLAACVIVGAGAPYLGVQASRRQQSRLESANRKLDSGQLDEAAREFSALMTVRPAAAREGLAAIALRRNDLATAQHLCDEALAADRGRAECLLIRGDVHVAQGQLDQARASYESTLVQPSATQAQRAVAYTRLGRLSAEQGRGDQAASAYAKAHELDPRNWESLSNMGALLGREGRHAEAVTALESAASLRPNDPLVLALLKENREAAGLARDRDRQRRVNELVEDLSRRYRRGDVRRRPAPADEWTSQPLTLSLLPLESRGPFLLREGENEFFLLRLGEVLQEQTRVKLVERTVLAKLLEELQLSRSVLVDPKTALQLGRVLSATLILVGGIDRSGSEGQIMVRVIETETSAVVASASENFSLSQPAREVPERLGTKLRDKLLRAYPLRARVVGGGDGQVTLNVGASEGATAGQLLQVFGEHASGRRDAIAQVEIVEVQEKRSQAKLLTQGSSVGAGLKAVQMPMP